MNCETLYELVNTAGYEPVEFDLFLIGDGSGQAWSSPAGWAVASIDRRNGLRTFLTGGASVGTVGWAEIEPHLHAVRHDFYGTHGGKLTGPRRVLVISDSQSTVRIGNGEYVPHVNQDMWAAFEHFKQQGYTFTWAWVKRNSCQMHAVVDRLSSESGKLLGDLVGSEDPYAYLPYGKRAEGGPRAQPE